MVWRAPVANIKTASPNEPITLRRRRKAMGGVRSCEFAHCLKRGKRKAAQADLWDGLGRATWSRVRCKQGARYCPSDPAPHPTSPDWPSCGKTRKRATLFTRQTLASSSASKIRALHSQLLPEPGQRHASQTKQAMASAPGLQRTLELPMLQLVDL
jgi:hypothetical protein